MTVLWSADTPVGQVNDAMKGDRHMTLCYVLLKPWVKVGPVLSSSYLRFSSVLLYAGAVSSAYGLTYLVVRRRGAAIAAGLLLATSPILVEYAREFRPEAMAFLATTTALLCLAAIIRTGTADRVPFLTTFRDPGQWWRDGLWLGLGLSMLVQMAIHPTGIVFCLIPALGYLAYSLTSPARALPRLLNYSLAMALPAALYLALYLPEFMRAWDNAAPYVGTSPAVLDGTYARMALLVYGNQYFPPVALVCGTLAALGMWRLFRSREWAWLTLLLVASFLMITVMLLLGVSHPRFRSVLWTVIPFTCLLSVGLFYVKWPVVRYGILAGLLLFNAVGVYAEYQRVREPYHDAARYLSENVQPGDVMVHVRGERPLFYSLKQQGLRIDAEHTFRVPYGRWDLATQQVPALFPDRRIWMFSRAPWGVERAQVNMTDAFGHERAFRIAFPPRKWNWDGDDVVRRHGASRLTNMVPLWVAMYEPHRVEPAPRPDVDSE